MKISASVFSNKTKSLSELITELDGHVVDYFHIDCNDDITVFEDIKTIRKISSIPIDLHIISDNPEKFFNHITENSIELVTFQFENLPTTLSIPDSIKSKLGLALINASPINCFEKYKDRFDFILFMTTIPGQSGGTFEKSTFSRIRSFQRKYPGKKIHVDGGVNADISFVLRNMGVYAVVSGSYLVNASLIGNALYNLRNPFHSPQTLKVNDIMMGIDEVPTIEKNEATFENILQSIENYNLGFTTLLEPNGKLAGLITNADVRKGLLKKINDLNKVTPVDILNTNPIKVYDDLLVTEMLDYIKTLPNNILYLPAVNRENILTGAITFTNLIKGE